MDSNFWHHSVECFPGSGAMFKGFYVCLGDMCHLLILTWLSRWVSCPRYKIIALKLYVANCIAVSPLYCISETNIILNVNSNFF